MKNVISEVQQRKINPMENVCYNLQRRTYSTTVSTHISDIKLNLSGILCNLVEANDFEDSIALESDIRTSNFIYALRYPRESLVQQQIRHTDRGNVDSICSTEADGLIVSAYHVMDCNRLLKNNCLLNEYLHGLPCGMKFPKDDAFQRNSDYIEAKLDSSYNPKEDLTLRQLIWLIALSAY